MLIIVYPHTERENPIPRPHVIYMAVCLARDVCGASSRIKFGAIPKMSMSNILA